MNHHSNRILVVDDNHQMRRVLRMLLKNSGFEMVAEAEDGDVAWAMLQGASYDLVVSDWHMPRMTGIELLRKIRGTPEYSRLPVLLVSGAMSRQDIDEAARVGANGIIMKQSMPETLAQRVRLFLVPPSAPALLHA